MNAVTEITAEPSAAESGRLREGASICVLRSPADDPDGFAGLARELGSALPDRLKDAIREFREHGSPGGGLLIHGLPVFDIPPTPSSPGVGTGPTLTAAGVLGIVAAQLGDQIGYSPELGGRIIQDVVPVRGAEDTQQSVSSTTELYTHIELAFAPDDARADWIVLFCLRSDHDGVAGTTLSPVGEMLGLLGEETLRVLSQPRFRTTVDQSFLRGLGATRPIWVGPIRVLSEDSLGPRLRADFAETAGIDPGAQEALTRLRAAAETVATAIVLRSGDLLSVDNARATHGRMPFAPRYDGRDRWLLRTSVVRDLAASARYRSPGNGRVIDIPYEDHVQDQEAVR